MLSVSNSSQIEPSLSSFKQAVNAAEDSTPDETLTSTFGGDFKSSIPISQEKPGLPTQHVDSKSATAKTSAWIYKDQDLCDETCPESVSPQSDFTPGTVTSARHLSFEELIPYRSSQSPEVPSDEDRPGTCEQHAEENLSPVGFEGFASQSSLFQQTPEMTSTSDEEYSIPLGRAETSSDSDNHIHTPKRSADFEHSDLESYFDCKQGVSDFSEPELDEADITARLKEGQIPDELSLSGRQKKASQKMLLSSGSEDYEDAPLALDSHHLVHEKREESEEEFSMSKTSQLPGTNDTIKSLRREITAELGSMSESSDDDFLTTRIIRRRVVIKADEMPDLPNQLVSEERYKDENGHIVIKRVTRKVIRKCVSSDGVEREEMSAGDVQEFFAPADGDRYSKVVKRTVIKSDGDHTEVTFATRECFPSSSQQAATSCELSRADKTLVEGERTMTTHVRAHMRKSNILKQTVVKGDGQSQQVLPEQVDTPRACDLQQQLHPLFHRCYEQEENNEQRVEE
uniref:Ankyrin 2b, neuronal n=2 Tax=Nothobranchius pienaari TaxID=704102 RepID=A0A1A8MBX1_9TELE